MSELRTEAGRRAETMVPHFDTCAGMRGPNPCDCGVNASIRAVEADAWGIGFTEGAASIPLSLAPEDLRPGEDLEMERIVAAMLDAGGHLPEWEHWRTGASSKASDPDDVRWECACGYAGSPDTVRRHWTAMMR